MGNKKLDNLFQEQLKNLEVSPNKRVWNNIEAQLKKKKRRVFPIWWFTGVAASILVVLSLFYPFSYEQEQNFNNDTHPTITKIPEEKSNLKIELDSIKTNNNFENEILISKKDDNFKNKISTSKSNEKEDIYQPEKIIKSMVLAQVGIDINFNLSNQTLVLDIPSINNKKDISQKLDIAEIAKKDEFTESKKAVKNWSVAPIFGVLKSNSLTDTSPINANLAESTSGENSYAYGVQVSYKLNNRWSIRSGIHLQEISYANNRIAVNTSSSRNPFATEFTNGDAFSFDTNTKNTFNEFTLSTNSFVANAVQSDIGNLVQNYGYLEIPLEAKYNLLNNKKIETNLITGFSTLLLNKNEVILNTQNFSRNLEAANLNNINFSGNFGFDFNYFISPKISLNINPMFKVQLNTFSNNSNGFSPFNIGLYSGFKYQF